MVSAPKLNPLTWNVPLVDKHGRPTKEFQIKWQQLNRAAQSIPSLSTPAAVSAVLDILSGTEGDLLVRGASLWEGLSPPNDATQFLNGDLPPAWANVKDSDLSLSDVTANDVDDTRHGFVPKAPNDATQYLDGTGQWSTPAGGGGGGATGIQLSKQSGNQSVPSFTHFVIDFDTVDYTDAAAFSSNLTTNTITVLDSGFYLINVYTRYTTGVNISDIITLDVNGTLLARQTQQTRTSAVSSQLITMLSLAANDVLTAYMDTNASATFTNTASVPGAMIFSVTKL